MGLPRSEQGWPNEEIERTGSGGQTEPTDTRVALTLRCVWCGEPHGRIQPIRISLPPSVLDTAIMNPRSLSLGPFRTRRKSEVNKEKKIRLTEFSCVAKIWNVNPRPGTCSARWRQPSPVWCPRGIARVAVDPRVALPTDNGQDSPPRVAVSFVPFSLGNVAFLFLRRCE